MRMTKIEYAEYLNSEWWQKLRNEFMASHEDCERCEIPRWLAVIAYDQDLHAHHKSYAHLGTPAELDDLESLCRRCHDVETHGRSDLRAPKECRCEVCYSRHWDPRSSICTVCKTVLSISDCFHFWMTMKDPQMGDPLWMHILSEMHFGLQHSGNNQDATSIILEKLSEIDAIHRRYPGGITDADIAPVDGVPF